MSISRRCSCVVTALALASLAACTDPPPLGGEASEIIFAGEPRIELDDAYPWVVRIVGSSGTCHGSLIAPGWVLTAAHCFDYQVGALGGGGNGELDFTMGAVDVANGTAAEQVRTFGDPANILSPGIFVHPGWATIEPGYGTGFHDLALLRIPDWSWDQTTNSWKPQAPFDVSGETKPIGLGLTTPGLGEVLTSASRQSNGTGTQAGMVAVADLQVTELFTTRFCAEGVNGEVMDLGDSGSALAKLGGDEPRVVGLEHGTESLSACTDSWTDFVSGGIHAQIPPETYRDWMIRTFREARAPNTTLTFSTTTCRTAPDRASPRKRADLAEIFPESSAMSIAQHPSTGTSYDVFEEWARRNGGVTENQRWAVGDFDHDGDQDLMGIWFNGSGVRFALWRSTGGSFVPTVWDYGTTMGGWPPSGQWLPGDFDGDGFTDLADAWQDGNYTTVTVYRSTPTGFAPPSHWAYHNGGWAVPARWSVGDFNNDGRDDILTAWKQGTSTTLTVRLGAPGTFTTQTWLLQGWPWSDDTAWIAGNFDAAAGTDVVAIENASGSSKFTVFRSNLSSFGAGSTWQTSGGWGPESVMRWQASDVDGDGDDDITAIWKDGTSATMSVRRAVPTKFYGRTFAAPADWATRRTVWQPATVWCAGSFDRT